MFKTLLLAAILLTLTTPSFADTPELGDTTLPVHWTGAQKAAYLAVEGHVAQIYGDKFDPEKTDDVGGSFVAASWLGNDGRVRTDMADLLRRRLTRFPICRSCSAFGGHSHRVVPGKNLLTVVHDDGKQLAYRVTKTPPFVKGEK